MSDSSKLFILNEKKPGAYCDRAFSVPERKLFRKRVSRSASHEKMVVVAEALGRGFSSFLPDCPRNLVCLSVVRYVFVVWLRLVVFEKHHCFERQRDNGDLLSVVHDPRVGVICLWDLCQVLHHGVLGHFIIGEDAPHVGFQLFLDRLWNGCGNTFDCAREGSWHD